LWFSSTQEGLGDWIDFLYDGHGGSTEHPSRLSFYNFLAATSSISSEDGAALLEFLEGEKVLEKLNTLYSFRLTSQGWRRVNELLTVESESTTAFVAMWFSKVMDAAYLQGFHKAIEAAGYDPIRIDRKDHNNKIDDEIIAEIRRCKFVVADFTSELIDQPTQEGETTKVALARGGVYFEAGFALGLGKPVIWCAKKAMLDASALHFDTRQFAHIPWDDPADLAKQLEQRIVATLGEGPRKKKP
jgi:hypothetical protein